MNSTTPLPTREPFLRSCLFTPSVTNEEHCAICLESYELAPALVVTADEESHTLCETPACGHKFGFSCLFVWTQEHNTCPMCRKEMYKHDEEDEEPNRSMQHELMIGSDFDSDSDEDYPIPYQATFDYDTDDDASSMAAHPTEGDCDGWDHDASVWNVEEWGINSVNLVQHFSDLVIESSGLVTVEEES
jgi:hypothetical protein